MTLAGKTILIFSGTRASALGSPSAGGGWREIALLTKTDARIRSSEARCMRQPS